MKYLLFITLFLVSCNSAKRIQKKIDNAQKIVDHINTLNPIEKPDSVTYRKGSTVTLRDTVFTTNKVNGSPDTIKIATFTTSRDTIEVVKHDYQKEEMYYRQLTEARAELTAKDTVNDNDKKYLRFSITANILLLLSIGFMVAKLLKF